MRNSRAIHVQQDCAGRSSNRCYLSRLPSCCLWYSQNHQFSAWSFYPRKRASTSFTVGQKQSLVCLASDTCRAFDPLCLISLTQDLAQSNVASRSRACHHYVAWFPGYFLFTCFRIARSCMSLSSLFLSWCMILWICNIETHEYSLSNENKEIFTFAVLEASSPRRRLRSEEAKTVAKS